MPPDPDQVAGLPRREIELTVGVLKYRRLPELGIQASIRHLRQQHRELVFRLAVAAAVDDQGFMLGGGVVESHETMYPGEFPRKTAPAEALTRCREPRDVATPPRRVCSASQARPRARPRALRTRRKRRHKHRCVADEKKTIDRAHHVVERPAWSGGSGP
ncbi:hypothetical protein LBMAG42_32790 [Deltaproteobacteria bacterium]|nr:hypothetical protein LBMAG42_32790 [Deltaproteobacteria bacterium]